MMNASGSRTLQSVQITLDIIDFLQNRERAGITEISSALDRSKGTVHGHLATLRENEYVVKEDGAYRLSLRYLGLGETVRERIPIYDAVYEELEDLAAETGELAQFAVEEHGRVTYICKVGGENAVRTASAVGSQEYMHCVSLGKAMLAHMPEKQVEEIVDAHSLEPYTESTITSPDELFDELAEIEEQGYAYDREEKISGLRCVATPIMTSDGPAGAISVSGPAGRFEGKFYEDELPETVTRSANVIEINAQFS